MALSSNDSVEMVRSEWMEISFGGKQTGGVDVVNERKEQIKACFFGLCSPVDIVAFEILRRRALRHGGGRGSGAGD